MTIFSIKNKSICLFFPFIGHKYLSTLTCQIIVAQLSFIFAIFSQGYSLIRKAMFINFNQFIGLHLIRSFWFINFQQFFRKYCYCDVKITLKKEDSLYIHLFWKKMGATFLVFFTGLCLFGRLLLFVFDKIPKAMLIWVATIIRQVRVPSLLFGTKIKLEDGDQSLKN